MYSKIFRTLFVVIVAVGIVCTPASQARAISQPHGSQRTIFRRDSVALTGFFSTLPVQGKSLANQLDTSGGLSWAKNMGGVSGELGRAIAVDTSGNVYTIGRFSGITDFDPGVGTFSLSSAGGADIFVSKLDGNGNFVWAKSLGGIGDDYSWDIAVDSSGNVYTTGRFQGAADFDPGVGTFNLTSAGGVDIFVSKLDSNGNFVWAKRIGGTDHDESYGIVIDMSGSSYLTGYFMGTVDFDPNAGTLNMVSAGSWDVFVSKLDSNGNFIWAKSMGGTGNDISYSVALDSNKELRIDAAGRRKVKTADLCAAASIRLN